MSKTTQGRQVVKFVERHCVFTNGEWIGRKFRLLPWQKRVIYDLFEVDAATSLRRHRWALIGVPKKNGKSELAAALALYFLIADDEPAPLVVCAAASEGQADLVFGAAKTMCELSPTLSALTETMESEITVPSIPGSRLRRLAARAGTNEGQNIHVVICDELHEWELPQHEKTWTVLTNSMGARRQPLVFQITTAGHDLETVCGRQYEHGMRVNTGEIDDPAFYCFWQEAPKGADYRDPAVWEAANPSYGVTVQEEFFADQLSKKTEAVMRRYFLNQWTASEEMWLPYGAWAACADPSRELDPALPLRVGIDVALRHDSSAVAWAQVQADGMTVLRTRVWANPYPEDHSQHRAWTFNVAEVEQFCLELREQFPVPATEIDDAIMPGPEFNYDPAYFQRSAQLLSGEGLAMVEFPQSDGRMIPASQRFFQTIVESRIAHDGDPVVARHVEAVIADQRTRGWRMSKPKGSRRKIDAAIAAAIAVYRAHFTAPEPAVSRWESEDATMVRV